MEEEGKLLQSKFTRLLQLFVVLPNKLKGLACLLLNLFNIPRAGYEDHFDDDC